MWLPNLLNKFLHFRKEKPSRTVSDVSPELRLFIATHEAGHVVVAWFLPDAPRVEYVELHLDEDGYIGGKTRYIEDQFPVHDQYLGALCATLAGRAAEAVLLGGVSTGCASDLLLATSIATTMVTRLGMSEELELRAYDHDACPLSEVTVRRIELEIERIIRQQSEVAMRFVATHLEKVKMVANALLRNNGHLTENEIEEFLGEKKKRPAPPWITEPVQIADVKMWSCPAYDDAIEAIYKKRNKANQ